MSSKATRGLSAARPDSTRTREAKAQSMERRATRRERYTVAHLNTVALRTELSGVTK